MLYDGKIWVGSSRDKTPAFLLPQMANRHGLIAGATGTGKTVTLKLIAEGFSELGVPVFLGDIKGDLSGMFFHGTGNQKITERLNETGVKEFVFASYPTVFWDVYGVDGIPIRTTVKEMGSVLLSRMLGLNDTQSGVLGILFRVAENENEPLDNLKDLKRMLVHIGNDASKYTINYGNISRASVGAIQRAVAALEDQGGNLFFGTPALDIHDWMRRDENGKGYINVLACDRLFQSPLMYSTFLMWMLTELYDTLPERGDLEKPEMVFFFDEAHLLFNDCSKKLMEKIEQIVRLIRSKGVGVYFITQNPCDIPMNVLGQLGNRVQHALRAYTSLDQKAVKVAAQTFRANPCFDTEDAITQLKTGEALVSFLNESGAPDMVERVTVLPPQSQMGTITPEERQNHIQQCPFTEKYYQNPIEEEPEKVPDQEKTEPIRRIWIMQNQGNDQNIYQQYPNTQPVAAQPMYAPQPVMQQIPVQQQESFGFQVFDPVSGQYVRQQIPQPMMQQIQQPVIQQPDYPQIQQPVMQQPDYSQMQQPVMQQVDYPQMQQPVMQQVDYPQEQPFVQQPVQPYVQQPMQTYQQPVQQYVQQPVANSGQMPETIQQNVVMTDPATGMTYQKTITMMYNPQIGQYVQVVSEAEVKAAAKAREKAAAAAAKKAKEEEAAERRQRADELREERAERARENNSVVGRIKNSAISSATRNITNKVINGVTDTIADLFKK